MNRERFHSSIYRHTMTDKRHENFRGIYGFYQKMGTVKRVVDRKIKNLLHSYSFPYNGCRPAG